MKNISIKIAALLFFAGVFLIPSFGQPNRYGRNGFNGRNGFRQERYQNRQYRADTLLNRPMNRMDQWGGQGRMYGSYWLDLTEEQQQQMEALRTAHLNTVQPLREKLAALRADQRTLLAEDEVDLGAVNKVIDEQTALTNQISKLQVEYNVKTRGILTEEQLEKLDQRGNFNRQSRVYGNGLPRSPRLGRSFHRNVG